MLFLRDSITVRAKPVSLSSANPRTRSLCVCVYVHSGCMNVRKRSARVEVSRRELRFKMNLCVCVRGRMKRPFCGGFYLLFRRRSLTRGIFLFEFRDPDVNAATSRKHNTFFI